MSRSPATKAAEAADALLAWLSTQPKAASPAQVEQGVDPPLTATPSEQPRPIHPLDRPLQTVPIRLIEQVDHAAPQRLAHTDWLYHRLTITGSDADLASFRVNAAGAGTIPWDLDLDRMEEDWFHLLVSPPPPQQRTLSVAGARIVAGQLRDVVSRRKALATARVGHSVACPFDLHALVPVPDAVLHQGPDDPRALAWLWEHWGTTQSLRHVAEGATAGPGTIRLAFWSADWTPWRALSTIAARWPALRFDTRPSYDPA